MSYDINIQFTNFGISPAKLALDASNKILFTDNDYFIVEPCKGSIVNGSYYDSETSQYISAFEKMQYTYFNGYPSGSSLSANMTYVTSEIGIILRYSYDGFLIARFNGTYVSLHRCVNQSMTQIGRSTPCALVENQSYDIKIEDMPDKIKVYIDGVYKTSFILENEYIKSGLFGVFAAKDNICNEFTVNAPVPDSWNKQGDAVVVGYSESISNDSRVLVSSFGSNDPVSKYIYQSITVVPESKYSYLINAGGETESANTYAGKVQIYDVTGDTLIAEKDINLMSFYEVMQYVGTFTAPVGCTQIEVRIVPASDSTICVDNIQINTGDPKPFIKTSDSIVTKGMSTIDLPANISEFGETDFRLSFKPYADASTSKNVIIALENETKHFILYYDADNKLAIDYMNGTLTYNYVTNLVLNMIEFNNIMISFSYESVRVYINDFDTEEILPLDNDSLIPNYSVSDIKLGYTSAEDYSRANGMFDFISVEDSAKVICDYKFDGAIQEIERGTTIYVSGLPKQFAPISVEYLNGVKLYRISSFDENGSYTREAIEYITYTGQKKITVSCNNIDSEYNMPYAFVEATDTDEGSYDLGFEATNVDGSTIYLNMDDEQSRKYIGKVMKVTYIPKDSYSITYNDDDNSFNITLHSHNGSPISISYESAVNDKQLIKSANMNPFYNPKHTGFLYLSDELEEASYIDVTVTPSYIDGKKGESALIILDVYDRRGNAVTDADISLRTSGIVEAEITRVLTGKDINDTITPGRADLQFIAGRYIYSYNVKQTFDNKSSFILKDVITIVENKTKILESTNIYIYV